MKNSFVGDVFNSWVGLFVLRAVGDMARLSGVACGAIEGCLSSWNGGRRCWDLSFLDAQTESMNSTKMAMKVGNSPVITRKFNPVHCGERGLFIPLALG